MPMEMGQHENSVREIQCKCSDGSIRPGFPSHLRVPGERGHVPTVVKPRVWITEPKWKGHGGFGGGTAALLKCQRERYKGTQAEERAMSILQRDCKNEVLSRKPHAASLYKSQKHPDRKEVF